MALNPALLDTMMERLGSAAHAMTGAISTNTPLTAGQASADASAIPMSQAAVTIVATIEGAVAGNLMITFTQDVTAELGTVAEMLNSLGPAFTEAGLAMGVTVGEPTLASGTPSVAPDVAVPLTMRGIPVGGLMLFAAEPAAEPEAAPTAAAAPAAPAAAAKNPAKMVDRRIDVSRIDPVINVQMEVTVEIGRTRLPIGELLALTPGKVIELDRPAGALVDLYINGTILAKGEIVVIDEEYGFRVTEIVTEEN
ncbi:MAG: flagellar motor switch protein FliN [Candidatus Nanopelagicales bacterium]|nr:flagellar motor switch protein FliN [Candidatus Nanopelagicales bacterium]